ncbi:hypothetical protein CTRI78_v002757 [Colletotrichum trifolii]|uniref:BZIP domain-containing protein n=1 Tax=Colletotrichum trifolii TaxID=5466 RepID=A0A4R8RTF6_COLTR|nr:hypothetical protein CTRI78_v002757 [Colletotrichum trifolii]
MSPTDAKTRRERGVLAQREYRKRHASKVQKLQDENQTLKDAISGIGKALAPVREQLPLHLREAIGNACHVAGVSKTTCGSHGASDESDLSSSQSESEILSRDRALEDAIRGTSSLSRNEVILSGRASPRLDYGLWLDFDRLVRVIEPPLDILPYLGAGVNTLAGCIFWSTLDYTIDLWHSRTQPLATKYLDRIFNHSTHLTDRDFLLSLAQARVDYKEKGFMYQKLSEQFQRNSMSELYERIKTDYEKQGKPSRWWKRPEEVAESVLDMMTPSQKARFEAVLNGKGTKADAALLRPLITWFAHNFICFGDGPRWSSVFVSVGIGSWINNFRALEESSELKTAQ